MGIYQEVVHVMRKLKPRDRERVLQFAQKLFDLEDAPAFTQERSRLKREVQTLEGD